VIAALVAAALLGPPVVVHDAQERSPLGSVGARPGTVAAEPVVYRRTAGGWVQFWMLYAAGSPGPRSGEPLGAGRDGLARGALGGRTARRGAAGRGRPPPSANGLIRGRHAA
jgi:hypothetical protein